MRAPLTDGANSAAHVGLGFTFGAKALLPFLFYQFVLQGDENAKVDTVEYLAGWAIRSCLADNVGAVNGKPDRMSSGQA